MATPKMSTDFALVRQAVDFLRSEGFDVQVFATRVDEDGTTRTIHDGAGNFNARLEMARRFVMNQDAYEEECHLQKMFPDSSEERG